MRHAIATVLCLLLCLAARGGAQIAIDNVEADFVVTILFPINGTSCIFDGCGTRLPDIEANDLVCQVKAAFQPIDCSCRGNVTQPPFDDGCELCHASNFTGRLNFTTIQQALEECPYGRIGDDTRTTVIEVVGVHYANMLMFPPDLRDVLIRGYMTRIGISNCSVVTNANVTRRFQERNPDVVFETLLNLTFSRIPIQPEGNTVIVGSNFQVFNPNMSLEYVNVTFEGCNTDNPLHTLCGWEDIPENVTGVCNPNATDPLDKRADRIQCIKRRDNITNCDSEFGFRLNCSRLVRPAGPCFIDGVFNANCSERELDAWNCSSVHPDAMGFRFRCEKFDPFLRALVDCRILQPFVLPSASPSPKPSDGCKNCPPKEKEETFVPCDDLPRFNRTQLLPCDLCLTNGNFTMRNSTVRNYRGPWVIKIYAYEPNVTLRVEDSQFVDLPGTVIDAVGMDSWFLLRNCFVRSGGLLKDMVYLKANFISHGDFELIANVAFLEERTLEPVCDYNFNGEVRCVDGVAQCLNVINTTLNDCTPYMRDDLDGILYDEDCAVYDPCPCGTANISALFNETQFNATFPDLVFGDTNITADGVVTTVLFDLEALGLPFQRGDPAFLPCQANNTQVPTNFTLPAAGANNTQTGSTRCAVNATMTNQTLGNCTESVVCPCPANLTCGVDNCNIEFVPGLWCQDGAAVCIGDTGFTNFTFVNGSVVVMFNNSALAGNATANVTSGNQNCTGPRADFCSECPVLNITRDANGTVIGTEFIPFDEVDENTLLAGGNATGDMWMLQLSYNFTVGNATFDCVNGSIECDCNDPGLANATLCYDVANCSTSFHIDHIPESAESFRIHHNLVEGLAIGLHIERVPYDVVADFSIKIARWFEETGSMHEIARQNNQFNGTFHDIYRGFVDDCSTNDTIPCKTAFCDEGCPMFRPREVTQACSVDRRFNEDVPDFDMLRFKLINRAIDQCPFDNIIIHKTGGVFEEIITLNRTNLFLASYNFGIVIRSNHTVSADNCTVRGIEFINDANDPSPLFLNDVPDQEIWNFLQDFGFGQDPDSVIEPPRNFSLLNNIANGKEVIGAGLIFGNFENAIIRYNSLLNYRSRVIDIKDIGPDVSWNYFVSNVGRAVYLRETEYYNVTCNVLVNCRGLEEGQVVDIIRIDGVDIPEAFGEIEFDEIEDVGDLFNQNVDEDDIQQVFALGQGVSDFFLDPDVDPQTCLDIHPTCWVLGNQLINPANGTDIRDVFIRIQGGNITLARVRDNQSTKSGFGMYFVEMNNIRWAQRFIARKRNPLIRNRDVQTANFGSDFLFRDPGRTVDRACSYPLCRNYFNDSDPLDALEINKNYDLLVHHPRLINESYGFNTFNNVSAADVYAPWAYVGNLRTNSTLHVTSTNGSRLSEETIELRRAITYRGNLRPCGVKPAIYGCHHLFDTWYVNMSFIEYRYALCERRGQPLWTSIDPLRQSQGNVIRPPLFNLIVDHCCFNGQNFTNGRVWAMYVRITEPNGTFALTNSLFWQWAIFPPGSKRLNTKIYINGEAPESPAAACARLRERLRDLETSTEVTKKSGREEVLDRAALIQSKADIIAAGEFGNATFETQLQLDILNCDVRDSYLDDCETAPQQTGREQKIRNYERKCPGGNCREYYRNRNARSQGRGLSVVQQTDGRLIRIDLAPAVSAVFIEFVSGDTRRDETIVTRSGGDSEEDFDEIISRLFESAEKLIIRRNLVSQGAFPPFVSEERLDELVEEEFNRTALLRFDETEVNNPVTGSHISSLTLRRQRTITTADAENNTFVDISGGCIAFVNVWGANITNNTALNCGMYDAFASAAFAIFGRRDSQGFYRMTLNLFNQTRSPLFPQAGTFSTSEAVSSVPVNYAAYHMDSMCDAVVFEFRNNTSAVNKFINDTAGTITFTSFGRYDGRNVTGPMYGLRLSGICNALLARQIDAAANYFPDFRPEQVPLRDIINKGNRKLRALICKVVLCELTQDVFFATKNFRGDCVCCRGNCQVPAPGVCVVDRDNATFVPGNPYFGTHLFVTLNDAVVNCSAPSRLIEVRKQDTPYVEFLDLLGPGDFTIFSPEGAVFRTSNIRINAPGLVWSDVTFEHEGSRPTITTDTQFLESFAVLNATFDGGGTFQPAIQGTFGNLTVQTSTFSAYLSDFMINVTSDCGHLDFQRNVVDGVPGAALYAIELNSYLVKDNLFTDSGARRPGINMMLYLQGCLSFNGTDWVVASNGSMRFENNMSFQLDTAGLIDMPDCGYSTTYYLNGLPPNGNWFIYRNVASGHQVGLRLLNFTNVGTTDRTLGVGRIPQATLYKIANLWLNLQVQGDTFDIVAVHQCDDVELLDTDPKNTLGLFCNDGCGLAGGIFWLYFFIGMIVLLILIGLLLTTTSWCAWSADTVYIPELRAEVYVDERTRAWAHDMHAFQSPEQVRGANERRRAFEQKRHEVAAEDYHAAQANELGELRNAFGDEAAEPGGNFVGGVPAGEGVVAQHPLGPYMGTDPWKIMD